MERTETQKDPKKQSCKLVLLGDSGVGKTSLVRRIVFGKFEHDSQPTQSVGFMSKKIEVPSLAMSIKFEIWDTAGQEKFKSLAPLYYRDAEAAICVFDITNAGSLESLKNTWVRDLRTERSKDDITLAIVGNKVDEDARSAVDFETATNYANEVGGFFTSTSAKEDVGVDDLFQRIAKLVFKKRKMNMQKEEELVRHSQRLQVDESGKSKDKAKGDKAASKKCC